MKNSALTVGAITLLSQGVGLATEEDMSRSGSRKLVKVKRKWTVTSDGTEGTGTGSDTNQDFNIAYAKAIQDLLDKLETDGHITRNLTESQNQWVPVEWVLKEVHTVEDGEDPPGPLALGEPFTYFSEPIPGESEGAIHVSVEGEIAAANSTLTMRWIWGAP